MGEVRTLSVTQLVRRMKNLIEREIGEVWVEGEVSNLRKQSSGHWYFSLKDDHAQVSCAMFGAVRREGSGVLADGVKVRVFAEASVYEARGQLQIVVTRVERAGIGDLQARFEALKAKLAAEGLFEPESKQPLPSFPHTIGIVTSPTGAALRDILNVLERRAPWVRVVLAPVRVQGKGAEREIARAIERLGAPAAHGVPRCEVLIVGRGGGSLEDLWNFNEEIVARAIFACPIPIVSAVGHEIDFTIADFVADLRAPTPSAAAELVVPDRTALRRHLAAVRRHLEHRLTERLARLDAIVAGLRRGPLGRGGEPLLREPQLHVDHLRTALAAAIRQTLANRAARWRELALRHRAHHPARQLERRSEALATLARRLESLAANRLAARAQQLARLAGLLRTLGPESAFQRGFSLTLTESGAIVRSATRVAPGDLLRTRLADGEIASRVEAGIC
jgi:exodeoxyribonuclease VII large subunit